ncbi:dihydrofolate reductase family protein [Acidilobus sp.]|uniref:dihydrofolate reductase family protein n=1 Tax=Acidilobus sp. TaxID=1872109 RepID=UPI003CFE5076
MRPYTIIFSTMSVDGRIATEEGFSRLSCDEDFKVQHKLRAWSDAVLVGANTAIKDNPSLTVRKAVGKNPLRVVVDASLKVPPTLDMFSIPGKGVIITTENHSEEELAKYKERGIVIIRAGVGPEVDLSAAVRALFEMGVRRLMIEGGGTTSYRFLKEGLVDELWITLSPVVFGSGISVINGERSLLQDLYLRELKVLCGGWIHLRYKVIKGESERGI